MRRASIAGWLSLALLGSTLSTAAVAQTVDEILPGESARVVAAPGSRVNVRSSPTIDPGNVSGQVDAEGLVTVQGAQRRGRYVWYQVTTAAELTGWIRGDLLEPLDRNLPATAPAPAALPAPAPPAVTDDWTRYVPTLLQPIDACLRSLSLQPVTLTRVFQVEPDMVGVRLRDPSGRRWECLITRNGNYPIRLDPLGDRVRPMPGDGDPLFIRAPGEAPSDSCLRTEEMTDPTSGMLLGWRAYKTC
jgi:hypothetical protein